MDGKFSQEYLVNVGVPERSIFRPTFFLLYINNLPHDVNCDIAIYADDISDMFRGFLGILLPAKQVLLERL